MINRSQIFKNAHNLAKRNESNNLTYAQKLSIALKKEWADAKSVNSFVELAKEAINNPAPIKRDPYENEWHISFNGEIIETLDPRKKYISYTKVKSTLSNIKKELAEKGENGLVMLLDCNNEEWEGYSSEIKNGEIIDID